MGQESAPPKRTTEPVTDLSRLAHDEHVVIMSGEIKVAEGRVVGKPWASGGKAPLDMVRLLPFPGFGFKSKASRAEQDFSLRSRTVLRVFVK